MSGHLFYVSLGSNLGCRRDFLKSALTLMTNSEKLSINDVSPVYETQPLGYTDQNDFLNVVVAGTSSLKPMELLDYLEKIERLVGKKAQFRYGPREIDIDILLCGDVIYKSDYLQIPHPELTTREFALRPLLSLDPNLAEPDTGKSYTQYLSEIEGKMAVTMRTDFDFKQVLKR